MAVITAMAAASSHPASTEISGCSTTSDVAAQISRTMSAVASSCAPAGESVFVRRAVKPSR